MNQPLQEVRALLDRLGHRSVSEYEVAPIGGGCISDAMRLQWQDGAGGTQRLFIKRNTRSFEDNFQCEFDGLMRLSQPRVLRVPQPVGVFVIGRSAWLVTEWIEPRRPERGFFERFGRDLAQLHRTTLGERVGLERDNYLGAARQLNRASSNDWVAFVAEQRLGFQLRWALDQGLADAALRRDVDRVIDRLAELLAGREEATSLLHGDLWSGNYFCDSDGRAVIFDPAVYHGCREAEWGMIQLFGGCPAEFTAAYQAESPLPDGWQRRATVYVLYHLLNHLNLFGQGYASQCRSVAAGLLRD